jgi:hypothetical protein
MITLLRLGCLLRSALENDCPIVASTDPLRPLRVEKATAVGVRRRPPDRASCAPRFDVIAGGVPIPRFSWALLRSSGATKYTGAPATCAEIALPHSCPP